MGTRKNKETEYLYASARVRAAENRLIGADKLESAISSKGTNETEALINSLEGRGDGDKLGAALSAAYAFIAEISPDENISAFLRYSYDCNNIKAAIKCHFRAIDCDEMLFSFGSVSIEKIKKMPVEGDFSALPEHMAKAAEEAFESYAKTKNPQLIDIILDKACFADMIEAAKASGEAFALRLAQEKIDLVNIMMCIRTIRMGNKFAERSVLKDSLIAGGELEIKELFDFSESGEAKIAELLRDTKYAPLAERLGENEKASLAELECECDNFYMKTVKSTKFLPFGAPILCSYLIASEYQVKNLRIILAGKLAGLSPEKLRQRVRISYV